MCPVQRATAGLDFGFFVHIFFYFFKVGLRSRKTKIIFKLVFHPRGFLVFSDGGNDYPLYEFVTRYFTKDTDRLTKTSDKLVFIVGPISE